MGCYCLLFLHWHSTQCCGVPPSDSTCSQAWWGTSKSIAVLLHAFPGSNYTCQWPESRWGIHMFNSYLALVAGKLTFPILQVWINLGPLLYHFAESYCQEEVMSASALSGSRVLYYIIICHRPSNMRWLYSRSWVWNELTIWIMTCNGKAGNVIRAQLRRCEEGCLTAWPYFEGMKLCIT